MKSRRSLALTAALALSKRAERTGSVSAVIVAAGNSVRFGRPKPFVKIGERFLFEYSLDAFLASEYVGEVILAIRKEDQETVQTTLDLRYPGKPVTLCIGGNTRDESTMRAFRHVNKSAHFVAFHDAARPLITTEEIDRVVLDAIRYGAATAASPVTDSVKRVKNGVITENVERDGLYAVSTPQIFQKDLYEVARAVCKKDGFDSTDDNAYVTHAGFSVHVTHVSENPKLTYPDDLPGIRLRLLNGKGETT
ncbi:MAG: 2-C-methyl-D-erythritol 4-phosphate cytidylyltransferase [Clostridia bacterium]|nr:2-C-methyl-D-erythritol 4-phosphate cytidylyltransferase [Clostridia bacterium]